MASPNGMNPNAPAFFVPAPPSGGVDPVRRPTATNLAVPGEEPSKVVVRAKKVKSLAVGVSASTKITQVLELFRSRRCVPGIPLEALCLGNSDGETIGDLDGGHEVLEVTLVGDSTLAPDEVFNTPEGALEFYRRKLRSLDEALTHLEAGDDHLDVRDDDMVQRLVALLQSRRHDDEVADHDNKKKKKKKKQKKTTPAPPPSTETKKTTPVVVVNDTPAEDEDQPLVAFLKTIRCEQYAATFAAEDIRFRDLKMVIQDSDLRDMGLPVGPRRRIQAALQDDDTQRVVTPPTLKQPAFPAGAEPEEPPPPVVVAAENNTKKKNSRRRHHSQHQPAADPPVVPEPDPPAPPPRSRRHRATAH